MNNYCQIVRMFYYFIFISLIKKKYNEILNIKNKSDLELFRNLKFHKLLIHCYKNVPYYQKIFSNLGVNSVEDLSKISLNQLPILTKDELRKNFKELSSVDKDKRKYFVNSSGGSTGKPVQLIQDKMFNEWNMATNTYYHEYILGIKRILTKEVRIWGNERDIFTGGYGIKTKLKNHIMNTFLLNSFSIKKSDIKSWIALINSTEPEYVRGYASSLFELCEYSLLHNLPIHSPKIVASAAETLTPDMRNTIENGFKTKLFDFYGAREAMNLAGECSEGLLHIFTFNNIIEIVDDNNKPVHEGEEGRILVTPLHNYSMPLLRYEIGDMGILGSENCSCGSFLPTLQKVSGRITDKFVLRNGTIIPPEFFIHLIGVVCKNEEILKFQVIQEDFEIIRIKIVVFQEINEQYKKDVEEKIKCVMGKNCKIIWECVNEILKTQSGKYRYTISMVK